MSDDIIKKDIKQLIEKETPNLTNLLSQEDVSVFKQMTEELRDTWHKKQMFRTETEAISVLQDNRYPTRVQSITMLEQSRSGNLMALSLIIEEMTQREYLKRK